MGQPRHGVEGWCLEDYDWDDQTGVATMEYSRYVEGSKEPEIVFVTVNHPALPNHIGWTAN